MKGKVTQDIFKILAYNISLPWRNVYKIIIASNNVMVSCLYKFDASRSCQGSRLCARPNIWQTNLIVFNSSCHGISPNSSNISLSYSEISLWITFSQTMLKRHMTTCAKFHLYTDCPLRVIQSNFTLNNDTKMLLYGSTLTQLHYQRIYSLITWFWCMCQ